MAVSSTERASRSDPEAARTRGGRPGDPKGIFSSTSTRSRGARQHVRRHGTVVVAFYARTGRPRFACSASTSVPWRRTCWRAPSNACSSRRRSPSIRPPCPPWCARPRVAARRPLVAGHRHRLRGRAPGGGHRRRAPWYHDARGGEGLRGGPRRRHTGPAPEAVDRAAREGEDLHAFIRDAIEALRLALVLKAAPTTRLADLTATEGNELRKLGEAVSLDEILDVLRALLDADQMMREPPHPRVELEIATVRATRRPVPHALEEVLRRVDEAEARLRGVGFTGGAAVPAPPVQQSILDSPSELPRAPGPAAGPAARAPRAERPRGSIGEPGRASAMPSGVLPPAGSSAMPASRRRVRPPQARHLAARSSRLRRQRAPGRGARSSQAPRLAAPYPTGPTNRRAHRARRPIWLRPGIASPRRSTANGRCWGRCSPRFGRPS